MMPEGKEKRMRRNRKVLIGALASIAMLAGCAATPTPAETTDAVSPEETVEEAVTISYTNFISNGGNEENLDKIVQAFQAENPNITVEVTTLPYGDYGTALQTDVAAGTLADVFDIEYSNYQELQVNGVLAPVEVSDPSIYKQGLLDAYSTDGASYALPSGFSTVVLFYNKDLFDAAGLDYPTSDWTWEDEKEAGLALTDEANGVWGNHQPVSFYEFYKVLAQAGGDFLNADRTAVAFNSPEGIEAATWLVEKSGTTMPTIEEGQGTPDFDTNLFNEGKLGMLHTGIWMFGAFADAPFAWDVEVEPGNETSAHAAFSNAVGINSDSANKVAAAKWAEYLTSSDIMVETRLAAGWELPPVADEDKLAPYLTMGSPANRKAVFDAMNEVAMVPVVASGQSEMQDIMGRELVEAQAGRKTVQEALATAEEEINALIGG
jgi:multiple sugar transport system substrate-binding protein